MPCSGIGCWQTRLGWAGSQFGLGAGDGFDGSGGVKGVVGAGSSRCGVVFGFAGAGAGLVSGAGAVSGPR